MTKKIINTSIIRVLFVFSAPLPLPVVVVGIINTFHVNNGLISHIFLICIIYQIDNIMEISNKRAKNDEEERERRGPLG